MKTIHKIKTSAAAIVLSLMLLSSGAMAACETIAASGVASNQARAEVRAQTALSRVLASRFGDFNFQPPRTRCRQFGSKVKCTITQKFCENVGGNGNGQQQDIINTPRCKSFERKCNQGDQVSCRNFEEICQND
jgi:hypothetical protein